VGRGLNRSINIDDYEDLNMARGNDVTCHSCALEAMSGKEGKPELTLQEVLANAGKKALGGGLPGAAAMAFQGEKLGCHPTAWESRLVCF
jgi:hypothetical protein